MSAPSSAVARLVDHATEIIAVLDGEGRVRAVNAAVERVLGYPPAEVETLRLADVLDAPDVPRFREALAGCRQAPRQRHDLVVRVRARDGGWRWVEVTLSSWLDDPGIAGIVLTARDITAWKQTAEALALSEERFRALVERVPAVIYTALADATSTTMYISPQIEQLTGYAPEAFVGNSERWLEVLHPDDRERMLAELQRTYETGRATLTYRLVARSGRVVWVRDEIEVVHGADGRPATVQGVMVDITSLQAAEEALRQSEQRFGALVRHAMDIIGIIDDAGTTRFVTPAVARVLGYPPERLLGTSPVALLHPEDVKTARQAFQRCADAPGSSTQVRVRLRHADGQWRWLDLVATNLREDPAIRGIVVNARDVTEQVHNEAALREAEERYRSLVERVPVVTYIQANDELATTRYISPQVASLTGYTAEEWLAQPELWLRLVHPEDRAWVEAEHLRTNATGEPFRAEYRLVRRDGSVVWVQDEGVLLCDAAGQPLYWQGVFLDVTERHVAEEALRVAETRYRTLVEQIPAVTWITRLGNSAEATYISPQIEQLTGFSQAEWTAGGFQGWADRLHPEDRRWVLEAHRRADETLEPIRLEYRLFHREGHIVWVRDEGALTRDADGRPLFWQGVMMDITAQKEAEATLRQREERFRSLVQNSSDVIAVIDAQATVRYVSPAVERVLGLQPKELLGRSALGFVHPEDVPKALEALEGVRARVGTHQPVELRLRHAEHGWRLAEVRATNLLDDPAVGGIVLNTRDVTERRQAEELLERQAFHDALTGLPNRLLLLDRIEHALARLSRSEATLAVFFLDLDRFKVINDSLGHAAGVELLVAVAQRLVTSLREGDTVARLGGDEFVVLLEDIAGADDALAAAERVLDALRAPLTVAGRETFASASIGISLASAATATAGDLLRDADIALYRAKADGRSRAVLFDESMNVYTIERLSLETDLRHAVARGELRLHYQPEVSLATGQVVAVEALARWQHPQRGWVPPGEFIPLAEETGLVAQIGRWVLREACRQARHWRDLLGDAAPLVSVNLSAHQVQQDGLLEAVADALRESGLQPDDLRLEITESVVVQEAGVARDTLQALKALGVRIAIDDFGIGYSSLAYLTRLHADTLKLDGSFVAALGGDERAWSIVNGVATLGHALGMHVTAEGIETPEQLAAAHAAGCDYGQGYYFARPLPCEDLLPRLRVPQEVAWHA